MEPHAPFFRSGRHQPVALAAQLVDERLEGIRFTHGGVERPVPRRAVPHRAIPTQKALQRFAHDREAPVYIKRFVPLVLREGPLQPTLDARRARLRDLEEEDRGRAVRDVDEAAIGVFQVACVLGSRVFGAAARDGIFCGDNTVLTSSAVDRSTTMPRAWVADVQSSRGGDDHCGGAAHQ